ncbi:MAG TPA: response regulator transcription factor, partial [Candidatus Acidoferrales bacterium]|nr:response regulator transcription factor [Candidatus Acidoferrales bacterium]
DGDLKSFNKLERGWSVGIAGITRRSKELSKSSGRVGTVRVFIADGSRMSCQLIAAALRRGRYRTRVVGYATDAVGIREGLGKNEADVAVIGARLEEEALAGFNVTREIRASNSKPSVVMILDSSKPTMVVEAFRAGASGVFSRDQSSELLCKCIHAVHRGQVWASSKELHFVIEALGPTLQAKSISQKVSGLLTKREEGVVHLVAEGLTNRDISHQLHLSEHTVRNYLFRIFNKVGTSSRLELALYAIDRREDDHQHNSLAAMEAPLIVANQSMSARRS